MKRHRFLVYFETYLTQIMQFVRNISSILQTWQNDRIWRLFMFWFHQKSFTTICELSWMSTTQSILSSRLRSVPPCRLRPPVLSDHICLAHWVVVIYRFYCTRYEIIIWGVPADDRELLYAGTSAGTVMTKLGPIYVGCWHWSHDNMHMHIHTHTHTHTHVQSCAVITQYNFSGDYNCRT